MKRNKNYKLLNLGGLSTERFLVFWLFQNKFPVKEFLLRNVCVVKTTDKAAIHFYCLRSEVNSFMTQKVGEEDSLSELLADTLP